MGLKPLPYLFGCLESFAWAGCFERDCQRFGERFGQEFLANAFAGAHEAYVSVEKAR